jgi:MtrB/PioB family decaheme-associated outer membrane protein
MNKLLVTLMVSLALTTGAQADEGKSIELGVIGVSDDSARFGKYTGLNESGAYLDANIDYTLRSENARYLKILGTNLGLDSRFIGVRGGQQGAWDLEVYYDQLPRNVFDDTATPFLGTDSSSLTLPANWVRAGNTQGMTALDATLRKQDIQQERQTLGAGLDVTPWKKLSLIADYRRTQLEGNRLQPGAFLGSSTELAQPIDFTTDDLKFGVGYGGASWNAELSYLGSFFRNSEPDYAWDNPYTTGNVDRGSQAQPPDNDFQQVALAGGWRGPKRTTLTGRIATGRMEQNEQFVPYTRNPAIVTQPLPQQNLAGKVDTTNVYLRATSSPWRPLRLNAEYRLDDRDNKTTVATYDYVITDIVPGPMASNLPYGYKRQTYALDADVRVLSGVRIAFGWDFRNMERTLQERVDMDTNRLWTKLRVQPASAIDASLLLATEKRDGSEYTTLTTGAPQNPLMRKYYMADRDRDEIEFRLGWLASDAVNLGFLGRYAEDKYDKSEIGVREASDMSLTLDGSIAIGKGGSIYGALTRETIKSEQANSQNFADPNWLGDTQDEFDTAVVGLTLAELTDKLSLDVDYTYSQSTGDVAIAIANSTQDGAFPELETKLHSFRISLDYDLSESTTVRVGYWYEHYRSDDWALDGVQPATVPNLLSLGANAFNYDVSTFLVSFVYRPR